MTKQTLIMLSVGDQSGDLPAAGMLCQYVCYILLCWYCMCKMSWNSGLVSGAMHSLICLCSLTLGACAAGLWYVMLCLSVSLSVCLHTCMCTFILYTFTCCTISRQTVSIMVITRTMKTSSLIDALSWCMFTSATIITHFHTLINI